MAKRSEGPAERNPRPFVQAAARIKPALANGHPWIYRDAVERVPPNLPTGTWVHVQCGNLQLYGLWDAEGAIAVRLLESRRPPNRAWVQEIVQRAWSRRAPLRAESHAPVTAYRWLFGEADGLPGLVADLYGDVATGQQWAVLRSYSDSLETIKPWVVEALAATTPLAGILERTTGGSPENEPLPSHSGDESAAHAGRAVLHYGALPSQSLEIAEYGVRFEADLLRGQKTGFFLDQRENRRTIGQWSRERRVLNLFAYTGGFSVFAALGGAQQVTSVDIAKPAIEAALRNFAHNGLDPSQHEFLSEDCFAVLEKYHGEGRRFDLIIVDPPSFARSRAQLERARHAYTRLNGLAMKCLEPGGLLASSSCTSQVSPEAFREILAQAAGEAKRRAIILHDAGQPLDHPVPAHFPEGRYLKFMLAAIETV